MRVDIALEIHKRLDTDTGMDTNADQYFPVPPQFLQDWPESCRNPEDSGKLAELGRTGIEFSRIPAKLEYIFKL